MKKLCLACILFLLLLPLSGFAQEADFHWDVFAYGFEAAAHLEAQEDVLQYDGSTAIANHEETAPEGFVFLLAEMYIEKTAPGGEGFAWENLFLVDQDGTRYSRMENDTFLEYYGYERLPATTLRIGKLNGWIAFEVPETVDLEQLQLVYLIAEQELAVPLTEKPEEE